MNDTGQNPETHIALFQRKEVRRTIHNNEWWFVVVDVVAALTEAANPRTTSTRSAVAIRIAKG